MIFLRRGYVSRLFQKLLKMKFLIRKYCAYGIKEGTKNEIECILQILA